MFLHRWLPTPAAIVIETLTVLAGTVLAAYLISRFPALQKFVSDNSVTLKI